jgi:rubrerythrin
MQAQDAALNALKQATEIEKEGLEFYTKAAERTTDRAGQEVFRSLAQDEELHLRIVSQQYRVLSESGEWAPSDELAEADVNLDKPLLFPADWEGLQQTIRPDASDRQALLFALEIEHRNWDLYRKAAQETENTQGKEMYRRLASAEQNHFNLVMLNYEHLTTLGHWLGPQG